MGATPRRPRFRWAAVLPLAVVGGVGAIASAPRPATVPTAALSSHAAPLLSFGRDVRPILASNCFKCHGPDEATRQAGLRLDTREGATAPPKDEPTGAPAIVPGKPDQSRLIALISSDDPDERMPPAEVSRHGLRPGDIDTLRRWIAQGAPYEPHWSFVPPSRTPAPAVRDSAWCRHDLDRFVLARLESEGLRPSAEAARTTLLRRVSLDLTGLPPTPEDVRTFLADTSDGAYERAVDRLLASPRFGEKWARWWLDMARYADTKGYEKDDRRTIWPYRDWVIRAFNADMPFDQFTVEQLAGDMLPGATRDQVLATAFHRNTMTNDEGGTDDEEFRVAAVVDRVNTTMEVWQGLTMACAQCHTHKYDPISHTEYYRFFALFNNTEDADKYPEESPYLRLMTQEQEHALPDAERAVADATARARETASRIPPDSYSAVLSAPSANAEPRDYPWLDDRFPALSQPSVQNLGDAWAWVSADALAPASGSRCFGGTSRGGAAQQFVEGAMPPLELAAGDVLYVYVRLDEKNPPTQIMLQWFADANRWEHRAFWGADQLTYGGAGVTGPAKKRLGDLPAPGTWARLEVPVEDVGLVGTRVTGWAFSQFGGTVHWDNAGLRTARPLDTRWERSLPAWLELVRARNGDRLPDDVKAAALAEKRTPEQEAALTDFYLRRVHAEARTALEPLDAEIAAAQARVKAIRDSALSIPVMHELAGDARRKTHRFNRGSFLSPAEEVSPGVPAALHPSADDPQDRLALARWLVSDENPLTARVIANRLWEQLWGAGIVETVEDFGTQGAWPSDQRLLDHLALRLRDQRWSIKHWLREVVTSATYRQESSAPAPLLERDPYNRLYARGARFRLDAETIRDLSLATAGLLSEKMYGPPVFPPQPDGLWIMIYSADRWNTSPGEDRYRRGLYTFWRRTIPYPAMTTFDAPSREFCVSRRIRTNTPLQALVTMNDPAYVECAQGMARRVLRDGGADDAARLRYAFLLSLGRDATNAELSRLARLLGSERAAFARDDAEATRAATNPLGPLPDGVAPADAAAWTSVCSVLLNLDETLTRE